MVTSTTPFRTSNRGVSIWARLKSRSNSGTARTIGSFHSRTRSGWQHISLVRKSTWNRGRVTSRCSPEGFPKSTSGSSPTFEGAWGTQSTLHPVAALGRHPVLALHQTRRKRLSCHVVKSDVVRQVSKQRNARPEEDRHTGDGQILDQTSLWETTDRGSAVDVDVMDPPQFETRHNLAWNAGHHLAYRTIGYRDRRELGAEHDDRPLFVRPSRVREYRFERLATDHDGVDRCHELVVAVGLSPVDGQPIQSPVQTRNESVETRRDENGCLHEGGP